MNMIQYSDITGKYYETKDAVFYRNVSQAGFMLSKSDMVLLDLFADSNGMLVFCFPRELHKKYIHEWHNRPHEAVEVKEWRKRLDDNNG
jgi:beta-galactosidase beta subunit